MTGDLDGRPLLSSGPIWADDDDDDDDDDNDEINLMYQCGDKIDDLVTDSVPITEYQIITGDCHNAKTEINLLNDECTDGVATQMTEVAIADTIQSDLTEMEASGISSTTYNDSMSQETTNEIISDQPSSLEQDEKFTSGKIPRVALKDLSDDGSSVQFQVRTNKETRNNQNEKGYQAERLVFNLLNTLTNIGCILIHGHPFKKNKQRTAEVDFAVVAPNHRIILMEVKSSSNERQLGSLLKDAINQIKNKIKPGIEREIEERYGKTVKISTIDCVMIPNMQVSTEEVDAILKRESLPAGDFVIASKIICAVPEKFKNWFLEQCYKKMEDSEANCEEMYETTIVS
ncbi:hypothetical protein GQR58_030022 [Nymphon striatum]|nr:hypothetical protein GQR58_030022 [Nymphon striatum]